MGIKSGYRSIIGDYVFEMLTKRVGEYRTKGRGKRLVDLGIGDVYMPPPLPVLQKMKMAQMEMGKEETFCGYGDECGYFELRRLISDDYIKKGMNIAADEIFITNGAKPALSEIIEVGNFKRALIFLPTYPLYAELCAVNGIERVFRDENCDLCDILRDLSGKNFVDLIFLCSPNNPTGKVYDEKQLKTLVDYAVSYGSSIVIDGAYAAFCEEYPSVFTIKGSEKCLMEVRSYSKSISYTGLRCGFIAVKNENPFNKAYRNYLSLHSNGINIVAQKGACAFYNEKCLSEVKNRVHLYRENAEILKSPFLNFDIPVHGGKFSPYVFCNISDIISKIYPKNEICDYSSMSDKRKKTENIKDFGKSDNFEDFVKADNLKDNKSITVIKDRQSDNSGKIERIGADMLFFEKLLNDVGVAVTPGGAFGDENCVRLSCLVRREVAVEGAKRIEDFLTGYLN